MRARDFFSCGMRDCGMMRDEFFHAGWYHCWLVIASKIPLIQSFPLIFASFQCWYSQLQVAPKNVEFTTKDIILQLKFWTYLIHYYRYSCCLHLFDILVYNPHFVQYLLAILDCTLCIWHLRIFCRYLANTTWVWSPVSLIISPVSDCAAIAMLR